jgi:hypothetical protein
MPKLSSPQTDTASAEPGIKAAALPDVSETSGQDVAIAPVKRAFTPPARWEDHEYSRNQFRGARPVWEMDGKVFAGPMLIPEVIEPQTAKEKRVAQATLFDLWHHAVLVLNEDPRANRNYHGMDERGRHRIT